MKLSPNGLFSLTFWLFSIIGHWDKMFGYNFESFSRGFWIHSGAREGYIKVYFDITKWDPIYFLNKLRHTITLRNILTCLTSDLKKNANSTFATILAFMMRKDMRWEFFKFFLFGPQGRNIFLLRNIVTCVTQHCDLLDIWFYNPIYVVGALK